MEELSRRIHHLEDSLERVNFELGKLIGEQKSLDKILRWVVVPLLVIVGALVGVDLAISP